jgi:hypothetical protein
MARATDRFLQEIRGSHTVYSYVDVISPNQETKRLIVVDGSINVDKTAQFRRGGTVNCIDPERIFVPDETTGLLTPYGTEVRPYRGVKYADGEIEVYPLGVFRLSVSGFTESSAQSGAAGVRINLNMFDRSRTVSRDRFTVNYTIAAGTNLLTAIKLILQRTFDDLEYDAVSTHITTTSAKVFAANDDPWVACQELAKSMGCEIYFNVDGWVVVAPPTDIDSLPAPDFEYVEGNRCTMMDLQKQYSDEPGFNGVIVTGSAPGDELPPVRAEAWDLEPSSPTYRYSKYGEVPQFINDTNVKTVAEAQKMADSLLRAQIGFSAQLSISAWTNPALEAGDVVQVERENMKVRGLYTVDAFNIPLRKEGVQQLKLRTRRLIS